MSPMQALSCWSYSLDMTENSDLGIAAYLFGFSCSALCLDMEYVPPCIE